MTVRVAVVIEATLDNDSEIDREKLFKLISDRYADFTWYGELSRYTIRTQFGELEIEYRQERKCGTNTHQITLIKTSILMEL